MQYSFYHNTTSWFGAQRECRKDEGHLVTLETERKWGFIRGEIQNLSNQASLNEWYIGLSTTYTNESDWRWITGQRLTNPHWQSNEPSGDGKCIVIAKNYPQGSYGQYNDLSCQTLKAFICEVELSSPGNRISKLR